MARIQSFICRQYAILPSSRYTRHGQLFSTSLFAYYWKESNELKIKMNQILMSLHYWTAKRPKVVMRNKSPWQNCDLMCCGAYESYYHFLKNEIQLSP